MKTNKILTAAVAIIAGMVLCRLFAGSIDVPGLDGASRSKLESSVGQTTSPNSWFGLQSFPSGIVVSDGIVTGNLDVRGTLSAVLGVFQSVTNTALNVTNLTLQAGMNANNQPITNVNSVVFNDGTAQTTASSMSALVLKKSTNQVLSSGATAKVTWETVVTNTMPVGYFTWVTNSYYGVCQRAGAYRISGVVWGAVDTTCDARYYVGSTNLNVNYQIVGQAQTTGGEVRSFSVPLYLTNGQIVALNANITGTNPVIYGTNSATRQATMSIEPMQ
jgi:hypothetical protein